MTMRLLPRTTTCNPVMVKLNGGKPYPTGYYDSQFTRKECCGKDPDCYGGSKPDRTGFFLESVYEFICPVCHRKGGAYITSNGASCSWNNSFEQTQGHIKKGETV